jgi:hypothetical protein
MTLFASPDFGASGVVFLFVLIAWAIVLLATSVGIVCGAKLVRNASPKVRKCGDTLGERLAQLVQGSLAAVDFVLQPEDVVAVEDAPDRGEWIAPAPVDAAHGLARRRAHIDDALGEVGVDKALHRLEAALIFLGDPRSAQGSLFLGDELGGDARAVVPGDADFVKGAAALPFVVEPAALTERRREDDEPALADGEHGPDGAIEVVGDAGGLVDDDEVGAVTADGFLDAGHAEDARAVGELDAQLRFVVGFERAADGAVAFDDFLEGLGRLTLAG